MLLRKESAEGISQIELRRLKRKRKKTRKKILLSLMLILMICICILFTPVFNLKEIEINGNSKIKAKELIDKSGFVMGENIFKFKLNVGGENIASIPYVNSVIISRKLPGKIEITITESIPTAYVPYNDTMIVVDKEGKALELKNAETDYKIPILYDFNLTQFALGKKINIKDEEKLKKTLEITKHLYNNNLIDKIRSINSQNDVYYLNINERLRASVGDGENLNAKLIMLNEVLLKLPSDASGIIDVRDPDRVYHRSE